MTDIFKKSDLKSGLIVETKNGERYLVAGDDLLIGKNGFLSLSDYDDDLKKLDTSLQREWDIQKVYNPYFWTWGFERTIDCDNNELIWMRDIVVITKQEIADLLNIPINKLIIS